MLRRLFKHKEQKKNIIWGIRAPRSVKTRWTLLSLVMRVPANRLVTYVLQDWVQQNADILLNDEARNKLAEHITQLYLDNQLS